MDGRRLGIAWFVGFVVMTLLAPPSIAAHEGGACGDEDPGSARPEVRDRAAERVSWHSSSHRRSRPSVTVKVLGFNDFHGQLSEGRLVGGRPVGGAAVLAAYLRAAGSGFEGRTLILHAGDHVGASPPASALLQDEPSITFLNLLGNEACTHRHPMHPLCNVVGTLGNHEFDEGVDEMLRLVMGGNHVDGPFLDCDYPGAAFPYVSANVVDAESEEPILPPYVIRNVGGARVAIIGAVLEETPTIVTPTGVAGVRFLDEAEAINRYVDQVRRRGVEAIVVTIHQGGRQTSYSGPTAPDGSVTGPIADIVRRLDGAVDVVVSGHAHSFTNAILPTDQRAEILVTQAFSASTAFADIELVIDRRTGDVVAKSASIVTTYADEGPGLAPDAEVQALVDAAEAAVAPRVEQLVGAAAGAITRAQNADGESALGNLIADAQRAAMGTDFAFMNPGGIRADLEAGEVTWGDLFTVQPFGNSLVRMTLTGAQIRLLLEQQWLGQTSARMLQVSGLRYSWDATLAVGSRVVAVQTAGGAPLDDAATYSVTANSFIAAGGDNFTVLTEGSERVGGPVDLDALITYIETLPQPFASAIEGRIARLP